MKKLNIEIIHEGDDYFKVVVDGKEYELAKQNTRDAMVLMRLIKGIVRRGELVDARYRKPGAELQGLPR